MRIFVDESGTQPGSHWLVIGMLFVPDHGALHSDLCAVKEKLKYFNHTAKKARYKETHLTEFKRARDVEVATGWIGAFLARESYFRSIVIDWSLWDGRYFGDAFDRERERRAT